jgi:hypothetical protein
MFGMTGTGGGQTFSPVSVLFIKSEQREQREQPEQSEQREQREQREQLIQSSQFFRLSSAACAASLVPKYSTLHLLPFASLSHLVVILRSSCE